MLTRFKVRVKKWVEPIQALMVPNGCSTVCRRTPMASGMRSSLACIASRTCSCFQRLIRFSLSGVHLGLRAHPFEELYLASQTRDLLLETVCLGFADVAFLALNHVSPRYAGRELKDEARVTFGGAIVPRDFDRIEIPFPERGTPILHKVQHLARTTSEIVQ